MEPMKGLETPEVAEALLSYVPPEDLKNARAVAKLWRDESLDNFRKSLVYVLDPKTESERLLKLTLGIGAEANEGGQNVGSLLPPMYRFQDKPFKKYRLITSQEFPPTNMESYEQKRYFWESCGPNVTYLDLKSESYFSKSSYIKGLIWLFKTCPNLEELSFIPVWDPKEYVEIKDEYYDDIGLGLGTTFDQRAKQLGILRRLPMPISKNDLEKIQENPGLNVKSMSIPFGAAPMMNPSEEFHYYKDLADQDHTHGSLFRTFWWCVFSFMPNLKKLKIERMYFDVMEALLAGSLTTGKLIQLETFIFNGDKNFYSTMQFRLEPLLKYLEQLEQAGGFLKNLTLKPIPRYHFWERPRTFRNLIFRIRKGIEKFHFEFKNLSLTGQPGQCKFDFFNFIFPNLTDLALEFDFDDKQIFLFFDFSMFRGTPNLKRFRLKYSNFAMADWLVFRKPLATAYLKKGGPGEKWHVLEAAARASEAKEDMQILQGDGDETFDPAGSGVKWEDQIVLEKMKEFYYTGRFTTKAILVFGKWMKNLKEFAIIFDDETIFIPFVVWPGTLKKLTVLKLALFGEGSVNEKSISELKEMYPEVEIVVEEFC